MVFPGVDKETKWKMIHIYVQIQIRLKADWDRILDQAGLTRIKYFGDWAFTRYDKEKSKRLITVAQK